MCDFKLKSGAVYGVSCYNVYRKEFGMRYRECVDAFDLMDYTTCEWLAIYRNNISGQIVEITRGKKSFNSIAYSDLIQSMFIDACGGTESAALTTLVYNRQGERFCIIDLITKVDGARIWSEVYVNGDFIRFMRIAD